MSAARWPLILALALSSVLITGMIPGPAATIEAAKPTRTPKPTPTPTSLTCSTSTTLESLVTCIVGHFGGFVVPTSSEQTDFRTVVTQMLDGSCSITLPASLTTVYTVKTFTDSGNSKTYCLMYETGDSNGDNKVDKGWGTVIVNNAPARELNQAAAHPVDDIATQDQAIGLFKATDSRTFLLAGATRNFGVSSCQDDLGYAASDAAHNIATMFFAATQALDAWYGARSWWQLQWHGMAVDSCSAEVYMTHGVTTPPKSTDKVAILKQNILKYHPTWLVQVPGDSPSCSLNATTNVEGRFLNGVPVTSCCTTGATSYSQKFLSIEQDPNMRAASDWVQAVLDTWP